MTARLRTLARWLLLLQFLAIGALLFKLIVVQLRFATNSPVGLLHGWLNGAGLAKLQFDVMALVGIVSAIFVLGAIAAAFVVSLRSSWMRVAVRAIGGRVAVLGFLMLGWAALGAGQ